MRLILFFVVLVFVLVAVIFAFWKQRVAAALWSVVLAIVIIRALLPSFPVRLFPFAPAVFWGGLVVQAILCYSTFRALGRKPTAVATKTNTNE